MFSGCKQLVVALLLGLVGLWAVPAGAQSAPSRLLFLGISKDGRPNVSAENAVQIRLGGLDVVVVRPRELSPCDHVDCLASALALTNAEFAFTGRVLKNEHACLAILWLVSDKSRERPIKQEIVCRPGSQDAELDAELADAASTMINEYRSGLDSFSTSNVLLKKSSEYISPKSNEKNRLNWKKKFLIAGLGILLAGGIAATAYLSSRAPDITKCPSEACLNIKSFHSATAAAGTISGALAASLLFVSFR